MSESPILRTALRVTKYDPALRDERGRFTGDDWIAVSDVGGLFSGRVLTLHDYLDVEARHLRVVAAFLSEADVDAVTAVAVQASEDARWWPREGESLSRLETTDVVREMLRERGFCRLEAPHDVYLHVGYDYYLYIGGNVPCVETLSAVEEAGLFTDQQFTSPYHVNPLTGEHF